MAFTVSLPLFNGPLDLLLSLIEKRELDISQLALASVTEEYIQQIDQLAPEQAPDEIAEFLVVAAKLLLIKSSLLLPADPVEEEEELGDDLAQSLARYRQYKQVASELGEREAEGLRSYIRVAPPPEMERRLTPNGNSATTLMEALYRLLRERPAEPEDVDDVVRPLRITVRDRIRDLTTLLRTGRPLTFEALMAQEPTRQGVIATFLAMLELLKLGWLRVEQPDLWQPIQILPNPNALPPDDDLDEAEIDEYQ